MAYFLLVYDQSTGELVQLTPYSDAERDSALAARFELEREHRLEPHIEVVVLGARDEETLRKTHARYFQTVHELLGSA